MFGYTKKRMMFNTNLIIVKHFDQIINEIDINTEKCLASFHHEQDRYFSFNDRRQKQLKAIDELKQFN